MGHKSGILTNPEPTEVEEKTAAQLDDEKRPAAMQVSSSMYDLAETDDRPAIEQKVAKGVIFSGHEGSEEKAAKKTPGGSKNFHIDADFAAEMNERTEKERAARKAKQEKAAKKEQQEAEKRKEKIAEELANSQTLDDEELRDKIKEEIANDNKSKLYPDSNSFTAEVEDELWRKRAEKGGQIAGRAKIEDVQNEDIRRAVTLSFVMEAIAVVFTLLAFLSRVTNGPQVIFYIVSMILVAVSGVLLFINGNKAKLHQVPSDQKAQFSAAAIAPGYLLRYLFIMLFSQIPMTGSLVGVIAGVAIGASFHYAFLNRYNIYVSLKDTFIMTGIYIVIATLSLLVPSGGDGVIVGMGLIMYILGIIEFFLGDRAAMLLALRTNK